MATENSWEVQISAFIGSCLSNLPDLGGHTLFPKKRKNVARDKNGSRPGPIRPRSSFLPDDTKTWLQSGNLDGAGWKGESRPRTS